MRSIYLFFFLLCSLTCFGQHHLIPNKSSLQSTMIWTSSEYVGKQAYVAYRKTFNLDEIAIPAMFQIFADSRYILWINGEYVLRGPCRFNPKRPEYDHLDVHSFLKKGKNAIVVLVHNYGNAINGRIMQHPPGLGVVLKISEKKIIRSDTTWRYNDKTMYLPSPESWTTIPDVIDARIDKGEWINNDYNDSDWPCASAINGKQWGQMYPRSIPLPKETELRDLKLLPEEKSIKSALPIELSDNQEVLIDLGQMALAYTDMKLFADAGSKIEIKHSLRYENGKLAEMYGQGTTYIARQGIQSFITTDQWGGHYVSIKCVSGNIKILDLKFIDRLYPFERIGKFKCSDEILTRLWDMGVNTLEVTCDDAYGSDFRERDEWLQDPAQPNFITTRVALAGLTEDRKKVFSDPRLLKNLLRHAALSQLPNGQILATFPTDRGREDCHYVIEDYACQWIEALKIYYNSTGDKDFLYEMWPTLVAQINWFLEKRTHRGLLLAREYTSFDNPFAYVSCEGATINAFFYQALTDGEYLAQELGRKAEADKYSQAATLLKSAFNKQLWNETEEAYNSAFVGGKALGPTVHAQVIALDRGIVPENRKASVRKWFLENYKNPGMKHVCNNPDFEKMVNQKAGIDMPVTYYWVFQELYRMNTAQTDLEVIQEIRRRWTPMVNFLSDEGTLAESFMNEKGEGSTEACHNYGALPVYFLSSFVLGVRLEDPVWEKKLLIEPRLGDLTFAEGVVLTEFGAVPVSWKKTNDKKSIIYQFNIPKGVQATVHFPKLSEKTTLRMNGDVLMEKGFLKEGIIKTNRWIIVHDVSGECSGDITLN